MDLQPGIARTVQHRHVKALIGVGLQGDLRGLNNHFKWLRRRGWCKSGRGNAKLVHSTRDPTLYELRSSWSRLRRVGLGVAVAVRVGVGMAVAVALTATGVGIGAGVAVGVGVAVIATSTTGWTILGVGVGVTTTGRSTAAGVGPERIGFATDSLPTAIVGVGARMIAGAGVGVFGEPPSMMPEPKNAPTATTPMTIRPTAARSPQRGGLAPGD